MATRPPQEEAERDPDPRADNRSGNLGINWNPPSGRKRKPPKPTRAQSVETKLHDNLNRLILYWLEHGDVNVRQLTGVDGWPQAGRFIGRLRMKRRSGDLPVSVEARAEAMGIIWAPPLGRQRAKVLSTRSAERRRSAR